MSMWAKFVEFTDFDAGGAPRYICTAAVVEVQDVSSGGSVLSLTSGDAAHVKESAYTCLRILQGHDGDCIDMSLVRDRQAKS